MQGMIVALKKKIAKKTKAKKTRKKPYFGKAAHAAVVEYQESDCKKEKNTIYEKKIRPSFEKLTENLIFIHGFSSDKETFHVLSYCNVLQLHFIITGITYING